ncbi:MBL fold metallo-hydrolase [Roseomonas sp. NAR14]|uniref:MBL fold metallo-hydrolase n=1 Tax=Roseomonas acroporae TaxID=2937791 RepID=A0A9X2BW55_9PROT|nr:MBL fold metallo-hydrolase [Roseomonas acroporae]MCK8784679.1 MBL fold metallo-hydrolase [Roseomonas acroporae]
MDQDRPALPRLRVLGCGDAFGSGGHLQACFVLEHAAGAAMLDCGATAAHAAQCRGFDLARIDAILLSHLHGDHFGGLPFLLLHWHRARRRRTLTIAGPEGTEARVRSLLDLLYPGFRAQITGFPIRFETLRPGTATRIGALDVTCVEVSHPSGAMPLGLRVAVDGRVLAYSGDTRWNEALPGLARGADLLLIECTEVVPGTSWHLDLQTLRAHRAALLARRILLTHLGPDMLAQLPLPDLEVAAEGLVVSL